MRGRFLMLGIVLTFWKTYTGDHHQYIRLYFINYPVFVRHNYRKILYFTKP
jgi:hypothetical protein